ncbi:hypothetical protein [Flavobacterium branchiophilum]|uniref:Lipoprotein n=1 Tax=Flavobacterium branchiophilum TaxID=55197 RepID=A0A2H3KAN2_9FLAO|nr:hypothetical protein [Flavobacterium branchiophilum]PDS23784.1 hypothetical protein B0A77_09790 [Flavobacterium branchiophilum]
MLKNISNLGLCALLASAIFVSCSKDDDDTKPVTGKDINTATKASVDRFSSAAGHLMVRTATNGLPAANAAINFDSEPFITTGLDRTGAVVKYYNFDVQPTTPDDIYVFFKADGTQVLGQNNIIPTIPGDAGYNDFWLVNKVTVPSGYVANSLTSESEVLASGYAITKTTSIANCPVVPFGSTASKSFTAGTASALTLGWYKGQAVAYFNFGEKAIATTTAGLVPVSPIYVMFNDNVAGPASGFKTETANSNQTHNVLATIPSDASYSPLWSVRVIDNVNFNAVTNLATATGFTSTPAGATVNCPIVK